MSLADELLDSLTEDQVATYSINSTSEPHIVINADRTITVPDELRHIAVQGDHNIETVVFDCPRYWDDHDLSTMSMRINYQRPDGHREPFPVENLRIDDSDSNTIHFDWTISGNVTTMKGNISFMVCAKIANAEGNREREWHSRLNQDLIIDEGLECTGDEIVEHNPDILESILVRLDTLESTGGVSDEQIANAVSLYMEENPVEAGVNEQEVRDIIVAYLRENPPEGGTVTNEQIAQAVEDYMAEHPVEGGYYTPKVSQPATNTMLVEHTPSKAGMPAVEPVTINLPVGSDSSQSPNCDFIAQDTAPENTSVLWIDTSDGSSDSFQNGNQSGVGWSTEEILLLETILKNCVTASDQTNNISALIAMLKNNSSGSEGSGSGGGDSGTTYTVTLNLTDVASSNVAQYVKSGAAYMNQLTVADGYVLGTPVVTMGGYDVTSQYYDGEGNIAISNVTGDIEITCKALAVETLTIVSASGVPDKTTFAYSEVASFTQAQVVAKESSIVGGVLNVTWDTETITGGPTVRVYLFKDGTPYKLTSNTSNSNPVETSDGISDKSWWAVPGSYAFPLKLTKPASIAIPDGCTAMVCLQRNGMINDTVTSNATWSAWAGAGNLTVTVTEGE